MKSVKYYFALALKGMGMGAANVIPGVSGGTIALITGIFEELIDSIKAFDVTAIRMFFTGKFKQFAEHINLRFLIAVFAGIFISILSLAKLLDYLFEFYPVQIWSYFFGLILASVYFVGKTIEKWNTSSIVSLLLGTGAAIAVSVLNPASENEGFIYLIICGVVAICSMILPGLSGSFVLILLGNYELVVIDAVTNMRLEILFPVILGAVIGLIAFSHLLSWIYKKFRDQTIAVLTGFILGSLAILWPWKNPVYRVDEVGEKILRGNGEFVIQGYDRFIPDSVNAEVIWAVVLVIMGIASIWIIEKYAGKFAGKKTDK